MKPILDKTSANIISAKRAWILRLGLALAVGWIGLISGRLYSTPVRADAGVRPVLQGTNAYPGPEETDFFAFPTDDEGYPEPGEPDIPIPTFLMPDETQQPGLPDGTESVGTPQPTATLGPTSTLPPDVLATENAEMSDSQVTPPGSETPAPSMTPYQATTGTQTVLPSAEIHGYCKRRWAGSGLGIVLDWLLDSCIRCLRRHSVPARSSSRFFPPALAACPFGRREKLSPWLSA